MRGAPGSGKSTTIAALGLQHNTLSTDAIRLLLSGPVLNDAGNFEINQNNDSSVFSQYLQLVRSRMHRGETIVFDAMHIKQTDFKVYEELAKEYNYEGVVLSFAKLPLSMVKLQNRSRHQNLRVSDSLVETTWNASQTPYTGPFKVIDWDSYSWVKV